MRRAPGWRAPAIREALRLALALARASGRLIGVLRQPPLPSDATLAPIASCGGTAALSLLLLTAGWVAVRGNSEGPGAELVVHVSGERCATPVDRQSGAPPGWRRARHT